MILHDREGRIVAIREIQINNQTNLLKKTKLLKTLAEKIDAAKLLQHKVSNHYFGNI